MDRLLPPHTDTKRCLVHAYQTPRGLDKAVVFDNPGCEEVQRTSTPTVSVDVVPFGAEEVPRLLSIARWRSL